MGMMNLLYVRVVGIRATLRGGVGGARSIWKMHAGIVLGLSGCTSHKLDLPDCRLVVVDG